MSDRPAFWNVKLTHLTKHRDSSRVTLCDCHVSTPTTCLSGNLTITNIVSSTRSHMLLQEIPEILNGIQIRTVSWPLLLRNKRNIAVAQPLLSQVRFVCWITVLHKKNGSSPINCFTYLIRSGRTISRWLSPLVDRPMMKLGGVIPCRVIAEYQWQ